LICGALWWLSYLNVYFVCFCVSSVGRVGVLSLFSASPAQFTQLKHCANVICAKIRRNRIFAAKTLFFEKKSAQKKRCPFRFFSGTERDEFYTPCKPEYSSLSAIFAFVLSFCVYPPQRDHLWQNIPLHSFARNK
jgi:hypothetical protein